MIWKIILKILIATIKLSNNCDRAIAVRIDMEETEHTIRIFSYVENTGSKTWEFYQGVLSYFPRRFKIALVSSSSTGERMKSLHNSLYVSLIIKLDKDGTQKKKHKKNLSVFWNVQE